MVALDSLLLPPPAGAAVGGDDDAAAHSERGDDGSAVSLVGRVSVLKVDVEGAEPLVFYGARRLIERDRPMILFERNEKGVSAEMRQALQLPAEVAAFDVVAFCAQLGYQSLVELPRDNFMLVHPDSERQTGTTIRQSTAYRAASHTHTATAHNLQTFLFNKPKW
jgi:hypothetical protein